ncbi:DUF937 domain-containing protein [Ferruginibacter sp. SUN106]|uniref:DUF937 domain-containing protein n=1 Tax=Ferruginibacter sp. SUN106 TaxID=2978348 RepID=UPI003D35D4BE
MKPQFNVTEASFQLFTDVVVRKNCDYLKEEEAGVRKALDVIIPLVLYGLAEKSATWFGITEVSQRATDTYNQQVLNKLDTFLTEGSGSYLFLLSSMYGNKPGFIIDRVSKYANIKYTSASSLISLSLYAVLGLIGKHKASTGISATGLAALLISEKNNLLSKLPPGLCLIEEEDEAEDRISLAGNNKQYSRGWFFGVVTIIGAIIFWGWLFVHRKEHLYKQPVVTDKNSLQPGGKTNFSVTNTIYTNKK